MNGVGISGPVALAARRGDPSARRALDEFTRGAFSLFRAMTELQEAGRERLALVLACLGLRADGIGEGDGGPSRAEEEGVELTEYLARLEATRDPEFGPRRPFRWLVERMTGPGGPALYGGPSWSWGSNGTDPSEAPSG
jgi:hypothetical protein